MRVKNIEKKEKNVRNFKIAKDTLIIQVIQALMVTL